MLYLYARKTDYRTETILDYLDDMVAAYRFIDIDEEKSAIPARIAHGASPALVDGEEVVEGYEGVMSRLEEFERLKAEWDKFQGDSCYCDEFGNIL